MKNINTGNKNASPCLPDCGVCVVYLVILVQF